MIDEGVLQVEGSGKRDFRNQSRRQKNKRKNKPHTHCTNNLLPFAKTSLKNYLIQKKGK